MHIYKHEMRANLKALLIWCAVMIVMIAMMTSEFSAYYDNPEMSDVLSAMPQGMLKALSMEAANLTTTTGFISLASIYFFLLLGVHAILLGSGIISKEERDKTAEFFMTLPISRERIILSKALAALTNSIVLNLTTYLGTILFMVQYDLDSDFIEYLSLLMFSVFIVQMIFMSIGMFLASVLKRYKTSGKIGAVVLMCLYIFSIVSNLHSKLKFLKWFTPFEYFKSNIILINRNYELKYLIISFMIITIGIAGTFIIYPKRDLHI